MAAAKVELKSSFVPFFQRVKFLPAILTLFAKGWKVRFSDGRAAEASSTELASAESEPWARDRASCGTPKGQQRL